MASFTVSLLELSDGVCVQSPLLAARWLEKAAEHPARLALALTGILVLLFGVPRSPSGWEG